MSETKFQIIPAPDHGRVLLVINGLLVAEIPYQQARLIGKLMMGASKECENMANPQALIKDQATIMAMGIPIALSNDLRIKDEAEKLLLHDKTLKQASKGGFNVPYAGKVSSPTVVAHDPK